MRIWSICLGWLMLASSVDAVPVSVGYLADASRLRSAPRGAKATFSLFGDSSCGGPPTYSEADVPLSSVVVERLRLLRINGGPYPLKIGRISTTMNPPTIPTELYLKVDGDYITAVGNPC